MDPELINETNIENGEAVSQGSTFSQRRAMLRAIAATPVVLTITSGTAIAKNGTMPCDHACTDQKQDEGFQSVPSQRWWEDEW